MPYELKVIAFMFGVPFLFIAIYIGRKLKQELKTAAKEVVDDYQE